MSPGKRNEQYQQEFWTLTADLSQGPEHVVHDTLNAILKKGGGPDFVRHGSQ